MGLFSKSYDTIEKARAAWQRMSVMEYGKMERIQAQAKRTKSNEKLFLCAVSNQYSRRKFAIPLITDPKALHMLVELTLENDGYAELTRCLCAKNTHLSVEDLVCILCHTGAGDLPLDILGRLSSRDDLMTVAYDGASADLRVAAARECVARWPADASTTLCSFVREGYPDLAQLLSSWPNDTLSLESLLAGVNDPGLLGGLALALEGSLCMSCARRLADSWPSAARSIKPRFVAHAIDISDFSLALELLDLMPDGGTHECDRAIVDAICARGSKAIAAKKEAAFVALVGRVESQDLLMRIVMDSDLAGRYDRTSYAKQDTAEHRVLDGIAQRLDDERLCELVTLRSGSAHQNQRHVFEIMSLASKELRQRPGGEERIAKIIDGDPERYSFSLVRHVQSKRLLVDLARNHPKDVSIKSALHTVQRNEARGRRMAAKTDEDIVRYLRFKDSDKDIFEDVGEKSALVDRLTSTEAIREVARKAVNPRVRSVAAKRLYDMGQTDDVERRTGVCTYCGGSVAWFHTYEGTIEERTIYYCPGCGYQREQDLYNPGPSPELNGEYYVLREGAR